ncbi:MAG: hypothetical protein GY758_02500 [Fuerstiella sp.]|nr:hypothetical protein [Fuerstiella sp.]
MSEIKKPAALDREAAQTMLNGLTLLYASVCLWAVGGISLALSLVVSTNDLGVTASDSFFGPFLFTGAFVLFMLAQCVDLSGRMACWVAAGRGDVNGRGLLMASICLNIVSVCIALWPNSVRGVPFAAYLDGLVPVTAALLFVGFVGYLAARIRDSAAQELTINCLGFLGTGAIAYVVLPVMVRRPGMGTVHDFPQLRHSLSTRSRGLVQVGRLFSIQGYGITYPLGSKLRKKVNVALLELTEGAPSVYSQLSERWFGVQ